MMKNRIWNRTKRLALSVILFTTAVCGNWGQMEVTKASNVDKQELFLRQSAQWTDENTYTAEILVEVSGLLAYKEKYMQEKPEENQGTPPAQTPESMPDKEFIEGPTEEPVDPSEEPEELPEAENPGDTQPDELEETPESGVQEDEVEGAWSMEGADDEELVIWEETAVYSEADEENRYGEIPQLWVENYVSEFFEPVEAGLPENSRVQECVSMDQSGREIVLGKVIFPIDLASVTEDVVRFSFPVMLREAYRYPLKTLQYPVSQDEPLKKDCAGTGLRLVEQQGEESYVLGQAQSPLLEVKEGIADMELEWKPLSSEQKAGSTYTCELNIKNTGKLLLKELEIESEILTDKSEEVKASWDSAPGVEVTEKKARIPALDCGDSCRLFMTVRLGEGAEGRLISKVKVHAPCPKNPEERIGKEIQSETTILPLKADFAVEKTADRTVAYPGDTVNYQICIRNTGERMLHSILSTERFLGANVQAQFIPKDGVTLNASRTQALIKELSPGKTIALQAAVTLPQNFVPQELVNQVTVVSKETGSRSYESESKIQVSSRNITPTAIPYGGYQVDYPSGMLGKSAYSVTAPPKTGDDTETGIFLMLLCVAALSGSVVFWKLKGKSKD